MLFLKQPLTVPLLCDNSATNSQIDTYRISRFKLKADLCNCIEIETIESIAPPQ